MFHQGGQRWLEVGDRHESVDLPAALIPVHAQNSTREMFIVHRIQETFGTVLRYKKIIFFTSLFS